MAGAGYKLFNTGDVLTAAQVNTYLQEQAVMRFANAAARTTALSGVLAEGMMSYLDDTNSVEVYNGSAWVSVSSDQTPLTTKGDLFTYSTTDARLPVGNNGETLVADSSATTGLRWQGHIEAGKNFLINGGFDIWQRGTSSTASAVYGTADRWLQLIESGSGTWAQETTVVPTGATYSLKFTASSTSSIYPIQAIESINATRLAGKRVVFSGLVAASTSTAMSMIVSHSSSVDVAPAGSWTNLTAVSGGTATPTSTTFVPISGVYDIPSTAKSIRVIIRTTSTIANGVVVYWGNLQLELGSVATEFSRAGGTLAGELAACQRYYIRYGGNVSEEFFGWGQGNGSTQVYCRNPFPVIMRTTPTFGSAAIANFKLETGAADVTSLTSVAISGTTSKNFGNFNFTKTGSTFTTGAMFGSYAASTTNAYLEWSAEL